MLTFLLSALWLSLRSFPWWSWLWQDWSNHTSITVTLWTILWALCNSSDFNSIYCFIKRFPDSGFLVKKVHQNLPTVITQVYFWDRDITSWSQEFMGLTVYQLQVSLRQHHAIISSQHQQNLQHYCMFFIKKKVLPHGSPSLARRTGSGGETRLDQFVVS